jgi:hypothetical protein
MGHLSPCGLSVKHTWNYSLDAALQAPRAWWQLEFMSLLHWQVLELHVWHPSSLLCLFSVATGEIKQK